MDTASLIEAYIATGQKIDVLWNFFVTVHIAIAGVFFLTTEHKKVHFVALVFLIVGYTAFSLINYSAKEIEYAFLNAVTQEISEIDTSYAFVNRFFDELSFSNRSLRNQVIHGFSAVAIFVVGYCSGFTCCWSVKVLRVRS